MSEPANGIGRHRRAEPFHGRHRRPDQVPDYYWRARRWPLAGLLLVVAATAVSFSGSAAHSPTAGTADAAQALQAREREAQTASRSERAETPPDGGDGGAETPEKPPGKKKPSGREKPQGKENSPEQTQPPEQKQPEKKEPPEQTPPEKKEPEKKEPPEQQKSAPPEPVGGLSKRQMTHAATIVEVGKEEGLPRRAYVVALATAMQESTLRNLANWNVPASLNRAHDGTGSDHDSVGLFQQRPSTGWGSVKQLMQPTYAARAFYRALRSVPGWRDLPVTVAAQQVQVSAFPDAYAKHTALARKLAKALE